MVRHRLLRLALSSLAILFVTLGLLEVTLRVARRGGLFHTQERLTTLSPFYRDENPDFGVWHPPEASYRAKGECFDVEYHSNAFGARDPERTLQASAPRVVVLGDSFVEGIGMAAGRRMTDLLERDTGVEHLNFGTAGAFGSIQEWRLYESLASRFDHDAVLLFAFPNNDFFENDPDRFLDKERYRPYLRRQGDSYDVYFSTTLDASRRAAERQMVWNRVYNALLVYRLAVFFETNLRIRMIQGPFTAYGYVGYEQFNDEDISRLLFTYRKIRDAAAPRPVVIFTIPRLNDLLYFAATGGNVRLPDILKGFASREPGISYYDLIPGFLDDRQLNGRRFEDYFLPCDGHWSELGNQVAAQTVIRAIERTVYASLGPTPSRVSAVGP